MFRVRLKKIILVFCSALCVLIPVCACGSADGDLNRIDDDKKGHVKRISLIVPLRTNDFWVDVADGAKEKSQEYGFDLQIDGPDELNISEQIKSIEMAIAAKVDGIITNAIDSEEILSVVNKAKIAGISVILVDSDAPESVRDYYVGTNNYDAGVLAGKTMAEATGGAANLAIISGGIDQIGLIERIKGFKSVVSKYPDMNIVCIKYSDIDYLEASQIASGILKDYPQVNAFFGVSMTDIPGAAKVISEKVNANSYTLIGFDNMGYTLKSIRDEVVYGTIVQDPYEMGIKAMKLLDLTFCGERLEQDIFYTPVTLVTKQNVDRFEQDADEAVITE